MIADIQTGFRLALRARYLSISLWLIIALVIFTLLSAQFSGRQPATVALDTGISLIRVALPLLIILFVQELFTQEFARRYYLNSLTYPRSRYRFLLGRLVLILALTAFLLIAMGVVLAGIVEFTSQGYEQARPVSLGLHYIITLAFILVDLFVITTLATLFAVAATTPSFVLIGTIGFTIVARSYSGVIELLNRELVVDNPEQYQQSLGILRYILPDLGSMDIRMISLYDTFEFLPGNWLLLIVSALAYGLFLAGLAAWFLQRKQFN